MKEELYCIVFATIKTLDDVARFLGFVAIGYLLGCGISALVAMVTP